MLLYVSDSHKNWAYNHKSLPGPSFFKQDFDSGFKSAPVRLGACNVECDINAVAYDLISGRAFDRKPVRHLVSSRNTRRGW